MTASESGQKCDSHILGRPYPRCLYKYRRLDVRSLVALARCSLYFVDYKLFNDPFEGEAGTQLEWLVSECQRRGMENEFTGLELLRICSFSAINDNVVMWGHYADSHKGFCLEFSLDEEVSPIRHLCFPVDYRPEYPELLMPNTKVRDSGEPPAIINLFRTKSDHWSYEQEWRAISHVAKGTTSAVHEIRCHPRSLTGIIFGMRMPDEQKNLIRTVMAGAKHVKYYQAIRDSKPYALRVSETKEVATSGY